jgi:ABC-type bacteriocin/lantibiotic exporter with double-glycine peptidase domain
MLHRGFVATLVLVGTSTICGADGQKPAGKAAPQAKVGDPKGYPPPRIAGQSAWLEMEHVRQEKNLCACASASMVLKYYGDDRSQLEIKALTRGREYRSDKAFRDHTVTGGTELLAAMRLLGYFWRSTTLANDKAGLANGLRAIRASLDDDKPVIITIRDEGKAHVVVVRGYSNPRAEIYLLDPASKPGSTTLTFKEFGKIWQFDAKRWLALTNPKGKTGTALDKLIP